MKLNLRGEGRSCCAHHAVLNSHTSPPASLPAASEVLRDVEGMENGYSTSPSPNPATCAKSPHQTSSQRTTSYQSFKGSRPSPSGKSDLFSKLMSLEFGSLSKPAALGYSSSVHSGYVGAL